MKRHRPLGLILLIALSLIGCGSDVDTTYGRLRGGSINGTGAFAELLRMQGHEVRQMTRTGEPLGDWADVIVRFAPQPGPIDNDEGLWLAEWLKAEGNRKLIYIPRDFDAEPEFWESMIASLPKDTSPKRIEQFERRRDASRTWASDLPPRVKEAADDANWFEFEPKLLAPTVCKTLEGPWSEGIDASAASVSKHEVFKVMGGEDVLLSGDGSPLAIGWTYANGSRVVVVANASFLLNATLLNRARRPLTQNVVSWVGENPAHVAFLEGRRVASAEPEQDPNNSPSSSPFRLLKVTPFNWIAAQFLTFLVLFAGSYAFRLGRPRPDPVSGVERPSAHPEALGALLARTGRSDVAQFLLDHYRRWRHPSQFAGRSAPTPPTSPR